VWILSKLKKGVGLGGREESEKFSGGGGAAGPVPRVVSVNLLLILTYLVINALSLSTFNKKLQLMAT
jgi:hypothetical protein